MDQDFLDIYSMLQTLYISNFFSSHQSQIEVYFLPIPFGKKKYVWSAPKDYIISDPTQSSQVLNSVWIINRIRILTSNNLFLNRLKNRERKSLRYVL